MNYPALAIEFLALLVAIIFYKKYKHTPLKWLLPFLIFICTAEILGTILRGILRIPNTPVYAISIPIEFSFYVFLFYHFLHSVRLKQLLFFLWLLMIVYDVATNINFFPNIFDFHILLFGNILMLLSCCFYFWELFTLENEAELFSIPFFWVAAGVFLFNLGEISYNILGNEIIKKYDFSSLFLRSFEIILCIILYSLIIKAMLTNHRAIAK